MANEKEQVESLRRLLDRMRKDWCDVTFIVEGERFPCNRNVVAADSPVLAKLLSNGMKETDESEIHLEELSSDVWRIAVDFVYTRELRECEFLLALGVLECAHRFAMEELESVVEARIIETMECGNCVKAYEVAEFLQLPRLRAAAVLGIQNEFHDVSCTRDFALLKLDSLLPILNTRSLVVESELDVLLTIAVYLYFRDEPNTKQHSSVTEMDFPCASEGEVARIAEQLLHFTTVTTEVVSNRVDVGKSEAAQSLFECVDLANMCALERQIAARLCRALRFDDLYKKCCDFPHRQSLGLRCPLDSWERRAHPRYAPSATFVHRFCKIANVVDCNTPLNRKDGTWIQDDFGWCRWKPRLSCSREDIGCTALEIFIEPACYGADKTTVLVDVFVLCGDESWRPIGVKLDRDEPRTLKDLRNGLVCFFSDGQIFNETDCLTVGTTIYFVDET